MLIFYYKFHRYVSWNLLINALAHTHNTISHELLIPYTANVLRAKTFAVSAIFQPIVKVFPVNHLLCAVHDGLGQMHHKKFSGALYKTTKVFLLKIFAMYV